MRTIRFGRTNLQVPAISLGTWSHGGPNVTEQGRSVGWKGHDDAVAKEALAQAWRAGITHWDTADVYGEGHAETLIGEMWGEVRRSDIFLATKVGASPGPDGNPYEPRFMRSRAERSLRLLQTDLIDLYYFHQANFGPDEVWLDEALDVMHRLREEGKIRFIGLSSWKCESIMKVIDRIDPDVVQPYRNVIDDQYESSGLKQWVDEHDLGVAFFSPLKHGLLLGKYEKVTEFEEGDYRRNVADFADQPAIDHYREAARQVSARFAHLSQPVLNAVTGALLADDPTACVLLGQRNPKQVAAAAAAGEPLSHADAECVRGVYRR